MKSFIHRVCIVGVFLGLFPSGNGSALGQTNLVNPAAYLPSNLEVKWFNYRAHLADGDQESARRELVLLRGEASKMGIENLDALSAVLIEDSIEVLNQGKVEVALSLLKDAQALAPNYPPAYFLRGKVLIKNDLAGYGGAISEYVKGWLEAFKNVWYLLYLIGTALIWIVLPATAALLVFIVILVFRYTPRMNHLLYELSKKYLSRTSIALVMGVFMVGPLWMGLGLVWAIIWWLLCFWIFMTGRERSIALIFVLGTATAGFWLPMWVSITKAKDSYPVQVMSQALRGEIGLFSIYGIEPQHEEEGDGRLAMAVGLQHKRFEELELAKGQFEKALLAMPEDDRVLVNIGNIYFMNNDMKRAEEYYEKAIFSNPKSVGAHYNLAQAYREDLRFEEGEAYYQKAQEINPEKTEKYTVRTAGENVQPVVDQSLNLSEVLARALMIQDKEVQKTADELFSSIWDVELSSAPLIGLLFGAILLLLSPRTYIRGISFHCALCGRAICQSCQKHIFHLRICEGCKGKNLQVKRLTELQDLERRRLRQINFARLTSLLIPGSGHLYLLHSIKGYLFSFIYFASILCFFWDGLPLSLPYSWTGSHSATAPIGIVMIVVTIYFFVFWDLNRFKESMYGDEAWQ